MQPALPIEISIGALGMKHAAVGDSIQERFAALCKPAVQAAGNWMTTSEDLCFRATVGALMLSYPNDSPEVERIAAEMRNVQKLSVVLAAAQAGLGIAELNVEPGEPLGLLGIWNARQR